MKTPPKAVCRSDWLATFSPLPAHRLANMAPTASAKPMRAAL
jgi:hypothetical protein